MPEISPPSGYRNNNETPPVMANYIGNALYCLNSMSWTLARLLVVEWFQDDSTCISFRILFGSSCIYYLQFPSKCIKFVYNLSFWFGWKSCYNEHFIWWNLARLLSGTSVLCFPGDYTLYFVSTHLFVCILYNILFLWILFYSSLQEDVYHSLLPIINNICRKLNLPEPAIFNTGMPYLAESQEEANRQEDSGRLWSRPDPTTWGSKCRGPSYAWGRH